MQGIELELYKIYIEYLTQRLSVEQFAESKGWSEKVTIRILAAGREVVKGIDL